MVINHPAAERNKTAIFEVFNTVLSQIGQASAEKKRLRVLELASGPGQHVEYFAGELPDVWFQPSEPNPELRASIDARVQHLGLANVAAALDLDARGVWPSGPFDLVMAVNLVHISAWEVTQALVAKAAEVLQPGGALFLYGPFRVAGAHTSDGNRAFDADLRVRNAQWGIRDLEAVAELGRNVGFDGLERVSMPANNQVVLLRRN